MTLRSKQQFSIVLLDANYGILARPCGAVFRANPGCAVPIDRC